MDIEAQRARLRENTRRYRERQKALGIKPAGRTPEQKVQNRKAMSLRRAAARVAGIRLPSETWFSRNSERHRTNGRNWRAENLERARELTRANQADRRATPWGTINNRIWPILHRSVRLGSSRPSKYTVATGYLWRDLRRHLERRFRRGMTWENWGDVWELDHITPLSNFKYVSLDDPLFREAWALSNLRPLWTEANQRKGCKIPS